MLPMIRFAYVMAIRRVVSGWRLEAVLFGGILLAVALMASGVIFSDLLSNASLRHALLQATPKETTVSMRSFSSQDERNFVGKTPEPVDPVDERSDLRVCTDLGELLVSAVHVSHDRLGGNHPFAVEADDYPEGPVGGRVLGPYVEGHAFGLEFHIHPGVAGLPSDVGHLSGLSRCDHESSASSPSSASSSPSSWPGMSSTSTMPGQGFTRRASSG